MPTSTLGQYPFSMSDFDTFAPSYQNNIEQYADFSPALHSSFDTEDCGTDVTTDSAPSPGSAFSPAVTNLYSLPQDGDWMSWNKGELPPDLDSFKAEPFDDSILSSVPLRRISLSPAVNPMELTNPHFDDVVFGREGVDDSQALFQFNLPAAAPQQRPNPTQLPQTKGRGGRPQRRQQRQQQQQQEQQLPPQPRDSEFKKPTLPTQLTNRRYLRTNLKKRKSLCSEEDDDCHFSQRSFASPPRSHAATRRSSNFSTSSSSASETTPTGAPVPVPAPSACPAPKKTAHNMIEKRYRNNLNDKIAALRDAVPALRVMVHRLEGGGGNGEMPEGGDEADDENHSTSARADGKPAAEDLGGLAPAHKLNKATILGKATEYILHLERRNRSLARENEALRGRMEGFEMMVMSRGGGEGIWN